MSKIIVLFVLLFLISSTPITTHVVSGGNSHPLENFWALKQSMQVARSNLGAAVVGDKIFAIGGIAEGKVVGINEECNPITGSWTFKANMPTPSSAFEIAVYQNKIYCIGAQVNQVYNPTNDSWEIKKPVPLSYFQIVTVNEKIYAIDTFFSNLTFTYEQTNDSWTPKTPIPIATGGTVIACNQKIYVIGSSILKPELRLIQIYDPKTDTWSLSSTHSAVYGGAAAATTGVYAPERIYFVDSKSVFDPITGIWQTRSLPIGAPPGLPPDYQVASSIPTERTDYATAVLNDKIYVIGGSLIVMDLIPTPSGYNMQTIYKDTVEEYTPFGYGTVPPMVSVVSPTNMDYSSGELSVNFTVNKPVDLTMYSLNGNENVTITGNTTITGLSNGLHNLTVYAQDTFGNIGSSETITFTVAKPESTKPLPTVPVTVASVAVVLVVAGLLVYHKKRRSRLDAV